LLKKEKSHLPMIPIRIHNTLSMRNKNVKRKEYYRRQGKENDLTTNWKYKMYMYKVTEIDVGN